MSDEQPVQEELNVTGPGVAPAQIEEIDQAAAAYVKVRDKRQKLGEDETEARDLVIDLLKKHVDTIGRSPDGAIRYRYEGRLVELVPTDEKLSVKKIPKEE